MASARLQLVHSIDMYARMRAGVSHGSHPDGPCGRHRMATTAALNSAMSAAVIPVVWATIVEWV
jgi:hypothetical protein